jgi:hypothetical protein
VVFIRVWERKLPFLMTSTTNVFYTLSREEATLCCTSHDTKVFKFYSLYVVGTHGGNMCLTRSFVLSS